MKTLSQHINEALVSEIDSEGQRHMDDLFYDLIRINGVTEISVGALKASSHFRNVRPTKANVPIIANKIAYLKAQFADDVKITGNEDVTYKLKNPNEIVWLVGGFYQGNTLSITAKTEKPEWQYGPSAKTTRKIAFENILHKDWTRISSEDAMKKFIKKLDTK